MTETNEKIRELLEKAKKCTCPRSWPRAGRHDEGCTIYLIDQVIALLKQEPTVENFEVPKGFTLVNNTCFMGVMLKLAPEPCGESQEPAEKPMFHGILSMSDMPKSAHTQDKMVLAKKESGEKDESFPDKIKRLKLQDHAYSVRFLESLIDEACELLEAETKRAEDEHEQAVLLTGGVMELDDQIEQLQAKLKTADGEIEKLKKYVRHDYGCRIYAYDTNNQRSYPCTCGLRGLDQALGKKGQSDG